MRVSNDISHFKIVLKTWRASLQLASKLLFEARGAIYSALLSKAVAEADQPERGGDPSTSLSSRGGHGGSSSLRRRFLPLPPRVFVFRSSRSPRDHERGPPCPQDGLPLPARQELAER